MFTKQKGLLDSLRPYLPEQVIDGLQSLYHNCQAKLFHRAPVTIEVDGQKEHVPTRDPGTAPFQQIFGALNVANYSSYYDQTNNEFVGGVAINVEGGITIQPSTYVTNNSTTFQDSHTVILNVEGSTWVEENIYVSILYDHTETTNITLTETTIVINTTEVTINANVTINGTVAMSPAVTLSPITSFEYDAATRTVRFKKTTCRVLSKDAEDANWTTVFTGSLMSFVATDVDVSSTALRKARTADVVVISTGSAGSLTSYHDGTEC